MWGNRDRDYNVRLLVRRLQRIEKEMSGEARDRFAAHIPNGDVGKFAAALPRNVRDDFTDTMAIQATVGLTRTASDDGATVAADAPSTEPISLSNISSLLLRQLSRSCVSVGGQSVAIV